MPGLALVVHILALAMDAGSLLVAAASLLAATVNGALGYGYSSITVPISLLVTTSRLLNPALVVIEAVVNLYALVLARRSIRRVWPLVAPVAVGILPGVAIGATVLASISAEWAKLVTYALLLPLILVQAAGLRLPLRRRRAAGLPVGVGVGVLYSMTTISGPPLAVYFNNQGLSKDEFKAALALARTIESLTTLGAYLALGVLTTDSLQLAPYLAPGVLVGLPLGFALIRRVPVETFRRVCMSFDAWLVAFGLSRVIARLDLVHGAWPFAVLVLTILVDGLLLRAYFSPRPGGAIEPGVRGLR